MGTRQQTIRLSPSAVSPPWRVGKGWCRTVRGSQWLQLGVLQGPLDAVERGRLSAYMDQFTSCETSSNRIHILRADAERSASGVWRFGASRDGGQATASPPHDVLSTLCDSFCAGVASVFAYRPLWKGPDDGRFEVDLLRYVLNGVGGPPVSTPHSDNWSWIGVYTLRMPALRDTYMAIRPHAWMDQPEFPEVRSPLVSNRMYLVQDEGHTEHRVSPMEVVQETQDRQYRDIAIVRYTTRRR